jgi:hypothetical protein
MGRVSTLQFYYLIVSLVTTLKGIKFIIHLCGPFQDAIHEYTECEVMETSLRITDVRTRCTDLSQIHVHKLDLS